jgi:uncharacterized protein YhbP (UPF0306 family)
MIPLVALCLTLLILLQILTHDETLHLHVEPAVSVVHATPVRSRNVTVALTGVSATGSVGSMSPAATVAL